MSVRDRMTQGDIDLSKVTITTLNADLKKTETSTSVTAMYNPTEYSVEKGANYAEQGLLGLSTPITQFVNGTAESLSMELFFDTYEEGTDVSKETRKLTDLLKIDPERHAPPVVRAEWGSLDFVGFLERANTRFTLFLGSGKPVRARMDVTFKQYGRPTLESITNPRNSSDRTKRRLVVEGETLSLIAAQEYGDPTRWRTIAVANDIDDPRTLTPGLTLVLPPLEE